MIRCCYSTINDTSAPLWRQPPQNDTSIHYLRHSHASTALREGETVLVIGRLLGHASPETTLKYTHLSDVMTMEAAEIVGAVLEGN